MNFKINDDNILRYEVIQSREEFLNILEYSNLCNLYASVFGEAPEF